MVASVLVLAQDREMAVRIVDARREPVPPMQALWRLVKGARVADACIWLHSHGTELRISVDGMLVLSQLYRPHEGATAVSTAVTDLQKRFEQKGQTLPPG